MSRLFLVRHGPTHEKSLVGHRDVPADLSDLEALARIDAHLPKDGLVVSSDLQRAADTATAIAGDRPRLPHHPGLREFDFGAWDGLHFSAVSAQWPDLSRRYWESPGDVAPPGGESWNTASARVGAAIDGLLADHGGCDLIVVAHFGAILTQVQRALACMPYEALSHKIDTLSVTEITTLPEWSAKAINQIL